MTTVSTYWSCRAAERRYELLVENEEISAGLVGTVRRWSRRRSWRVRQLSQFRADQQSTAAQRIRNGTGVRSGEAAARAGDRIRCRPGGAGSLTSAELPVRPSDPDYPELIDLTTAALALRDDLHAARSLEISRKVLVTASFLNLRPIIDLRLDAGYVPFDTRSSASTDRGGQFTGERRAEPRVAHREQFPARRVDPGSGDVRGQSDSGGGSGAQHRVVGDLGLCGIAERGGAGAAVAGGGAVQS